MLIFNGKTVPTGKILVSSWLEGGKMYNTAGAHTPVRVVISEHDQDDSPTHFTILGDGHVVQSADPVERLDEDGTVFIRILVPKTPTAPWDIAISTKLFNEAGYVLPTLAQLEATAALAATIAAIANIPSWMGAGLAGPVGQSHGIMAASLRGGHGGLFPVFFAYLRVEAGDSAEKALRSMIWIAEHTTGGKKYNIVGAGGLLVAAATIGLGLWLTFKSDAFSALKTWMGSRGQARLSHGGRRG